jgi:hypothetical protein
MDIIEVKDEIIRITKEMDKIRSIIVERTNKASEAESNYYKLKAMVIMELKAGKEFNIEEAKIKNPQASYISELVKGICHNELLKKLETAGMLKSAYVQLSTLEKQLSALQSIFKQLSKA